MLSASLLAGGADCAWKAKWISKQYSSHETNTWLAFRKTCELGAIPQSVTASIAADTKYWMWINGEMVVREGGLKRGPAPGDGYFDQVEIAPYLHEGRNVISILVWYFGRSGFSHMSSGIPALLFQAEGEGVEILSDGSWEGTAPGIPDRILPCTKLQAAGEQCTLRCTHVQSHMVQGR